MYIDFGGVVMFATVFAAGMVVGTYIVERRYKKALRAVMDSPYRSNEQGPKANETTE